MNQLYKPDKVEVDDIERIDSKNLPSLGAYNRNMKAIPTPDLPETKKRPMSNSDTKFRLDIWNKNFWQEPHLLGTIFHGAADVLLPGKYQRLLGLVEDAVDGNPTHRKGGKGYWTARKIVQVGVMIIIAVLIALAIGGQISWDQLSNIINQLLPILTGYLTPFVPLTL